MKWKVHMLCAFALLTMSVLCVGEEGGQAARSRVLTHADAAMILAKYSGLFDRYVSPDASLSECVAFLNKTGIYFGLMEVVGGKAFTLHDCARVMGQMNLVFNGEAEYAGGKVKLPKDIDSWDAFCIINGVQYVQGYEVLNKVLRSSQEISR